MKPNRTFIALSLALVAALGLLSCNGDNTSPTTPSNPTPGSYPPSSTPPAGTSSVTVKLTDSPFSDAKAVLVTFSEVSIHQSGGPFKIVPFTSGTTRTCDLKKLQGAIDVLGVGNLPTGHYTQIRLVASSAAIYFDNAASGPACAATIAAPAGASAPVKVSSGDVKLNRQFDLKASNATTITLDFDGNRSIKETGNGKFMMTPVIGVVSVQ